MADIVSDEIVHESELYNTAQKANYLNSFSDITESRVAQFHNQGYLAIRQAFSPDQIETAGQAMWDLIDGKNPDFPGVQAEPGKRKNFDALKGKARRDSVRKLWKFVDYDKHLDALAKDPHLLSVLTRLQNDTPVLFQDMGLIKPPFIGTEKPWHQDCAYFDYPTDTTIIGVWIAIDAATEENGCLHIIPGSNQKGPEPHFSRRDWQICDTEVKVAESVTVPLEPGGCLIWHGLTHHGSPTNKTEHRRRALQYHYRPESAIKLTKEERLATYGGDQLGVTC